MQVFFLSFFLSFISHFLKGHEEYHISHSFFFTEGCVYCLLFDCSIKTENIIKDNKILYWLNFIETQVGEKTKVILIATKVDILEKKFNFFFRESETREAFSQIHESK